MSPRAVLLPVLAAALVGGVLGVQVANGGGEFAPARSANPCAPRAVASVSTGIEGLGERLVLLGLDGAACRLHVSREALVLELARPGPRTKAQVAALRAGLLAAVNRMKREGSLPRASDLANEAVDDADLPFFVKIAIRALPDSLINAALKTDDVLRRTVDNLDLRGLLAELNNPNEVSHDIQAAVTRAVKDALIARLRDLLP
jgi:hypothetical protein